MYNKHLLKKFLPGGINDGGGWDFPSGTFKPFDLGSGLSTNVGQNKAWYEHSTATVPTNNSAFSALSRLHLEKKLLDKNKNAWSNNLDGKAFAGNKGGGKKNGQPSDNARTGDCRQWRNEGKCSRGNLCPWKHSHTQKKKRVPSSKP